MPWTLLPINDAGGYIDTVTSNDYRITVANGDHAGSFAFGSETYSRYFYITDANDPAVLQTLVFEVSGISNPGAIDHLSVAVTASGSVLTTMGVGWALVDNKPRIWFNGSPDPNATTNVTCEVAFLSSSNQRIGSFQFNANRGSSNRYITFRAVNPSNTSTYTSTKVKYCSVGDGTSFYPYYIYSGEDITGLPDNQIRIYNLGSDNGWYYNDVPNYNYLTFGPGSLYLYIDINYYYKYYENIYYLKFTSDTTATYELYGNYWVGSTINAPSSASAGTRTGMTFKNWLYNNSTISINPGAQFRILFGQYKLDANWEYDAVMKVRVNNQWRNATVYVAHNGEWVVPQQVLVRQNGTWKNSIA